MEAFIMNEDKVFCERVINELDKVLKNSQSLVQTFEVIQVPFKQNKSPIRLVHNHLGIESWCIRYVYQYAHQLIISHRKQNRLPASIVKYLNCAILINPDVATFWNIRRYLVERVQLNLTQEFQFSSLVLSKKPKSSEAFFYRRWLYSFQSGEAIDWAVEISLCERCSERKNGNYHAWNHRQWVLQKAPNLLSYEIIKTEKFIRKNIADYSCYHHRHFVLSKLFDIQYYDVHDNNLNEIYRFVNVGLSDEAKVNNLEGLIAYLFPNISIETINMTKLNSLLYLLNLIIYDLNMIEELILMHGKYEAFKSYKRVIISLALRIIKLCTYTDYLTIGHFTNTTKPLENTEIKTQNTVIEQLLNQLDSDDNNYIKIFF
ncbi:CLUMA_CG020996, isoform A [Clunio marinus]|uniref:CLUMA_CG020996, isoform A n=1 Tax=Clunio marinus TaxID=568069 RepID=A0A1J1JAU0_9DIPT|nr:CLUMA_CG020996, isoform A [Clunio marinus]